MLTHLSLCLRTKMTNQRFGLTEGLVIAVVPATGYWFAFLYELGYCKYFEIPPAFIEIGLLNVLVAIIGLGGVLALFNLYADPVFILSRGLPKPLRAALFRITVPIVLVSGYAIVARLTPQQFSLVAGVFLVPLVIFEFIFPLLTQRDVRGYLSKLEAQNQAELQHETIMDVVAKSIGRRAFLFFGLLFVLSFTAYFAGGYEAKKQLDFMVIDEQPEKVVLKRNGAYSVTAQIDREKKSISRNFALIASEQEFQFRYERVGPLSPEVLEHASK